MAAQFARPHHHIRPNGPSQSAPNAALLIDFDNVTMGIRSDLSKEIKNLLNSDIIKGKVAVQRAYADWRRYPQYVVDLAEASVDLIFAPAYGSAKKNATDIRLAIDALELVFTRPEIGTFILLSGDSDFSSLVLKLKEYGKYVIGVGLRESASDLLVQNCDEYYSYSILAGLTKASDEDRVRMDPWDLVEKAVRQMATRGDVMRSDRLKQVMLEMDGNFNEKEIGFSKFSRFLSDAVSRGRIRLKKGENGQWEVSPPGPAGQDAPAAAEARKEAQPQREEQPRGRRGRGRDQERAPRGGRAAAAVAEEAPRAEVPGIEVGPAIPEIAALPEVAAPEVKEAPVEKEPVVVEAAGEGDPTQDLRAAYDLLRQAVEQLVERSGEMARDSDVKRRILELHPGWDESTLGFSKFSRFLRQAHDAEVIDLHRGDGGSYQLTLSSTASRGRKQVEMNRGANRRGAAGARRQASERTAAQPERKKEEATAIEESASVAEAAAPAAKAEEPKSAPARDEKPAPEAPADAPAPRTEKPAAEKEQPAAAANAAAAAVPAAAPRGIGFGARLGTRGRVAQAAPPPVLPGQAVVIPGSIVSKPKDEPVAEPTAAPSASPKAEEKKAGAEAGSKKAASRSEPKGSARKRSEKPRAKEAAPAEQSVAERYGLPTDKKGVEAYILGRYKGVGPKTLAALIDAFGADKLFDALESEAERIREVLGSAHRASLVLDAWKADLEQRAESAAVPADSGPEAEAAATEPAKKKTGRPARRSSGGRKSKAAASKDSDAAEKAAVEKKKPAQRRGRRTTRAKAGSEE